MGRAKALGSEATEFSFVAIGSEEQGIAEDLG